MNTTTVALLDDPIAVFAPRHLLREPRRRQPRRPHLRVVPSEPTRREQIQLARLGRRQLDDVAHLDVVLR